MFTNLLLLLGFFFRWHVIATMIQINMMQMVIRALVVAATMMINVRLASLVSLVLEVTPTVLDGLEIVVDNVTEDVTFSLYTVVVLFTTRGVEADGTAVAGVCGIPVGVVEVDNDLLDTLLEDDGLTTLVVIAVVVAV